MYKNFLKPYYKTLLSILWFAFTFSLVMWWWVFLLQKMGNTDASHRMFTWEGSILIAAIFLGGFALILFSYRDQKRHLRLRFFFSTFSHDIKTSIARLRLQAEVLEEDLQSSSSPILKRLINDIHRLDLQLENSLLLTNLEDSPLLFQKVALSDLFSTLKIEFTDLNIELDRDASLQGDRRALLSVFRNLLQNAVIHGQATSVRLQVQALSDKNLEILVQDNGSGFQGAIGKLGSEILVSTSSHGNGIGLLLTKRLLQKMRGNVRFESRAQQGFCSRITLEGQLS